MRRIDQKIKDHEEKKKLFIRALAEFLVNDQGTRLHGCPGCGRIEAHEAYAVILEEVDEFWDLCQLQTSKRDLAEMRKELVQIAAMCWRAARNLGLETTTDA